MSETCVMVVTGCVAVLILCIILIAVVMPTTAKTGIKRDSFILSRAGYAPGCPDGYRDTGVSCTSEARSVPIDRQSGSSPCPPGFQNMGINCFMPTSTKPYNPCKGGDKLEGRYCYSASVRSECSGVCANALISPNGGSVAALTASGLLVVSKNKQQLWINGNAGSNGPYKLQMQEDGNLVIYDKNNAATWASSGGGGGKNGPYKLVMQDDGNLVVYDRNGRATWASQSAPQSLIKM